MIAETGKSLKENIPVCNIMGVDISAVNMWWLLEFTRENIRELSGDYMCVANVYTTVIASENESYRAAENGGVMAIPDGGPLSSLGRKRGFEQMFRTTGPEYMEEIFKLSAEMGWRHYFYGSTQATLEHLSQNLQKDYPGIQIAGMYSPPFRQMTQEEDAEAVKRINEANADFVWVGLGAPKQEYWMAAHKGRIRGFMVGVGAGFDYHAGNLKRAPRWMQDHSLEWLYRLAQEPKRLFVRYLVTNTKFIWNAVIRGK